MSTDRKAKKSKPAACYICREVITGTWSLRATDGRSRQLHVCCSACSAIYFDEFGRRLPESKAIARALTRAPPRLLGVSTEGEEK